MIRSAQEDARLTASSQLSEAFGLDHALEQQAVSGNEEDG